MADTKFGWSYPPGVSERDLPGNSPDEQAQEALIEAIYEALAPFRKFYDSEGGEGDDIEDQAVASIEAIMGEAYAKGKNDAQSDEALIHELQPFNEDDMRDFLEERKLTEDYAKWLSTKPLRS